MAEKKQRRRMLVALVILLVALAVILLSDSGIWFGPDKTANRDNTSPGPVPVPKSTEQAAPDHKPASTPESVPNRMAPVSVPNPASTAKAKNAVAAKHSAEPAAAQTTVISATRTELPPLEVEVVAGDRHRIVRPGTNSLKVEILPHSGNRVEGLTAFEWSPITNAAERTPILVGQPDALSTPVKASYPSLARQMKVEGSVLLQALVGADGSIQGLRVLGGNPILVPAALEAARQWRFRPYLQNGQPVETQAKIMVEFKMKIL
jgi:TonB family protein